MKLHVGKPAEIPEEQQPPARRRWKWPSHLFGGRVRTSTVVLIVLYAAVWWVYDTYREEPQPPAAPQVVPPGFIPDPAYTWVPRTRLQQPPVTVTQTTTPTPTTTDTPVPAEPSEGEPPPPSPVPGFPFCPPLCPPPAPPPPPVPEEPGPVASPPDPSPPSATPGAPTPSTQPGPPGSQG